MSDTSPVQLELFPTEEDSVLYDRSATYASLGDVGRRVVRAYLSCLEGTGKIPTQSELASKSGLSRHAVSNQLGERSAPAWQAITEILASCRDRLAVQSSIAIPALAWLILRQFLPGQGARLLPRDTSSLTPTELKVLQAAAAMGGVTPLMGGDSVTLQVGATSGDGQAAASVTIQGEVDGTLADLVSKLREVGQGRSVGGLSTGAGHPVAGVPESAGCRGGRPNVVGPTAELDAAREAICSPSGPAHRDSAPAVPDTAAEQVPSTGGGD